MEIKHIQQSLNKLSRLFRACGMNYFTFFKELRSQEEKSLDSNAQRFFFLHLNEKPEMHIKHKNFKNIS